MKRLCLLLILLEPIIPVLAQGTKLDAAYTCMRMGDFACAAELFEKQAGTGDSEAQFQLGKLYLSGRGIEKNAAQAQKWFRLAATNDKAAVQYALGVLLLGDGEQAEAALWLKKAAAQNHAAALAKLEQIGATESNLQHSIKYPQDKWHKAVVGCHSTEIKQGLAAGVRINEVDTYQRSALYYLVACGDAESVATLLDKGALPNTVDRYGQSPLTLAVRKNEVRIASLLLNANAIPGNDSSSGETMLHIAVRKCSEPMVAVLLASKAAHSEVNSDGQTPLDLAVDLKQKSIEKLLVNVGAQHGKNWSPSLQPSSEQTLSYLKKERFARGDDLWHSAVQAVRHEQTTVLAGLIKQNPGELLSKEDEKHRTLLMYATELQSEICISLLINAGAKPNQGNIDGLTALMIAAKNGDEASTVLLLSLGASPAPQDSHGRNAVHIALLADQDATANKLLKTSGLPAARTHSGKTYLMLAIEAGTEESLNTILEQDTQLEARDKKFRTAVWYAANTCNADLVEQLLALGSDPRVSDTQGHSILHAAVNKDCAEVVQRLLHTDINLDKPSKTGNTALMLAAQRSQLTIVEMLLAQKIDIGMQNKKGDTALLLAVRGNKSIEVITRLLEAGSDPYRRNELGESAQSIAELYHPEVLDLIKNMRSFSLFGLNVY